MQQAYNDNELLQAANSEKDSPMVNGAGSIVRLKNVFPIFLGLSYDESAIESLEEQNLFCDRERRTSVTGSTQLK